ncbi:MAG: hypothetical protein AAGK03_03775 [Pseudomonadota bacterium]
MVWKTLLSIGLAAGAAKVVYEVDKDMRKEKEAKRLQRLVDVEPLKPDRPLTLDDFEDPNAEYFYDYEEEAEAAYYRLQELSRAEHTPEWEAAETASKLTSFTIELDKYGDEDEAVIQCAGTLAANTELTLICVPHTHGKNDWMMGDEFEEAILHDTLVATFDTPSFEETLTWPVTPGDRLRFKTRFSARAFVPEFDYEEDDETGLFVVFGRTHKTRSSGSHGTWAKHNFGAQEKRVNVPFFAEPKPEVVEEDVVGAFFDQLKAKLDEVIKEEDVTAMAEKTISDYIDSLERDGREVPSDLRAELARVGQKLLDQRVRGKGPWGQT